MSARAQLFQVVVVSSMTVAFGCSHKIAENVDPSEIIAAAMANQDVLLDKVVAPAGSTLVFFESTIHASGVIESDKDRPLIISGWTPANMG